MNTRTRRLILGSLITLSLAASAGAAEPSTDVQPGKQRQASQWTLSTADTEVTLSVSNNKIFLSSLKNPAQNWNWAPVPWEVPLPTAKNSIRSLAADIKTGSVDQTPDWTYTGASEDKAHGYTVILRFLSTTPALELQSVWRAKRGRDR